MRSNRAHLQVGALPKVWLNRVEFFFVALGFLIISGIAVRFANERIYADAAYFLMHVAEERSFHVINGRWIIVLTQWLPVIGTRLDLPMQVLIGLFSIGNVALLAAGFAFVTFKLKDRAAGLTLIAVQFIGLAHAHFCPIFEFYYGALLLIVFHAVLRTDKLMPWFRWTLLSVLFVLVISSHFMGMLVMGLLLVMERIWTDRRLLLWLIVLLVAHLLIRTLFLTAYEANAFRSVLIRLDLLGVLWTLSPGRLWAQLSNAIHQYPDTLALSIFATALLIRKADRWGLMIFLAGISTIYVLTSLYLPDATQSYYREIVDYPATVWVLIVILTRILPEEWNRLPYALLLLCALCFRSDRFNTVSRTYAERVEGMEELIDKAELHGIRRGLVQPGPPLLPPGFRVAPIAPVSPMEILLLSARKGPDAALVLIPLTPSNAHIDAAQLDEQFDQEGLEFPTDVNGVYFHMPTGPFTELK